MDGHPFMKMHGLGNDFVVLDDRTRPVDLNEERVRALADRHTGVGCDQLIVLEPSDDADVFMRIYNADGGEVGACGNAARCVGWVVLHEGGQDSAVIETASGPLSATVAGPGRIRIDMGPPRYDWRDIPLAEERDTLHLGLESGPLTDPVGVSMGNPHAVFFVDDVTRIDIAALGPGLEHHPLFPERANIGVAEVQAPDRIRLRVWERGAGLTRACGTGACAALVAASRRGLTGRSAEIVIDGGSLSIEWEADEDGHVYMTGPVAVSFMGVLAPDLLP
ncbi:MAG: diaminopimelate epimerase [Rhodospirillaceae bacterium]|nr:diaminopimelate epimerase [Rhodospirillaceae bacterium]